MFYHIMPEELLVYILLRDDAIVTSSQHFINFIYSTAAVRDVRTRTFRRPRPQESVHTPQASASASTSARLWMGRGERMLNIQVQNRSVLRSHIADSPQHHVAGEMEDKQKSRCQWHNQCVALHFAINPLRFVLGLPNSLTSVLLQLG